MSEEAKVELTEEAAQANYEAAKKAVEEKRTAYLHLQLEDELASEDLLKAKERKDKATRARSMAYEAMAAASSHERDAWMAFAKIQLKSRGRVG